ncbi:MAG: hypothetical protein GX624_05080 [Actinobacteria bacterium]|nr:hypothetical protein [Actinomycetota bacterium]
MADVMLKTRTYGAGRICKVDGCGTRLSAYNPSSVCALHGGAWREDLQRTARRAAQREEISRRCAFDRCGREFTTTNPAKKYCSDACRMKAFQARMVESRRTGAAATPVRRAS